MNKTELIEAVATRSNTTKTQTTAMLNGLLEVIQETMASGSDVQLVGFGTFSVTERASREGRNPATGVTMTIPAKKVVKFKPGKALSDAAASVMKTNQTEKKK
ncbi:MAG: HU family DNA-binding protein [Nitrosomonas sp.]|jgi:DNA-binding protein HU-beta|uniref:HU family DNA-binding protein n=3 Tax=Nitrosomonas sp. TaxID=42353 RepID=UPI0027218317|nr:HU family DNA-binding protein [Nitrosomonas sp.]MDO8895401.1 HU family DNA-binding protein [Nitrosomonas sp.]MDO9470007.1 HU family DNA-binding protein [Nitrosomonas sp.]MDP1788258.1 HU family DNA-binding protein [Nitrosomonas sp.]MDP2224178.1 HU family DNA-binding protein [Nitrosomonas sp.]